MYQSQKCIERNHPSRENAPVFSLIATDVPFSSLVPLLFYSNFIPRSVNRQGFNLLSGLRARSASILDQEAYFRAWNTLLVTRNLLLPRGQASESSIELNAGFPVRPSRIFSKYASGASVEVHHRFLPRNRASSLLSKNRDVLRVPGLRQHGGSLLHRNGPRVPTLLGILYRHSGLDVHVPVRLIPARFEILEGDGRSRGAVARVQQKGPGAVQVAGYVT